MYTTMQTTTDYRQAILNRLRKDLEAAKHYLKICRQYIVEASAENDNETASFWAQQHDRVLMELDSIKHQLKHI